MEKKELWKERILSQQQSAHSVIGWCQENNIHPRVFYYWKKKLSFKNPITRDSFIELPSQEKVEIVLEYRGATIRFDQNIKLASLKKWLIALGRFKC